MAQNEKKNGAMKWLLIIVAAALLVFICWKAGWILTGEKNNVSEQEKQEAVQEAVEEVNATMEAERSTVLDAQNELQGLQKDLKEAGDEVREELQEANDEVREEMQELNEALHSVFQ
jgi:flagellar basal body-associated protein FliL